MSASAEEMLDVLNDAGEPTGERKARLAVHVAGDWHRAIHIWVVRDDDLVLLQRRSLAKDLEAGRLDVSVGGHYRAGELFIDVLREAEEELGLVLRPGQLEYLGTARTERRYLRADPPRIDREVQEVYVTRDSRPLEQYSLSLDEVEAVYELQIDRAIGLFANGEYAAAAGFDAMRRPNHSLLIEDDLPVLGRGMHLQSLQRVRRWLAGEAADMIAAEPFNNAIDADEIEEETVDAHIGGARHD